MCAGIPDIAAEAKAADRGYLGGFVDTLSIAGHGLVNFGGGVVNALADTADLVVDVVQTTFNVVSPTCWTKTFCAAIPNIPSVPIYGDPALCKYSQMSGYATTVAVEFVAGGGAGLIADGFSATVTAAKTLPRLVTELPSVVNDVKSAVRAAAPAVKALVPKLPGLVKTTVTGVVDNAASIVKNPGAFLGELKSGLSNPITTPGGIFGTPTPTERITAPAPIQEPGLPAGGGQPNFMTNGDKFADYAAQAEPLEGYHDVIVHGSPTDFGATPDAWEKGTNFSHRTLAQLLKRDPSYDGGPIRLMSCSTGACDATAAQNLANALGTDVLAPTDKLWAYPNGTLVIGPDAITRTGKWVPFSSGVRP